MSDSAPMALEVEDVHHAFGGQVVLSGVDLRVATGTVTAVLGPSGCGKTTLLRIIAGFLRPQAGSISLNARPLVNASRFVAPERRRMGIVPQEGALFPHLTVAQNVGFGLPRAGRRPRVEEWLERVGLTALRDRRPHELSGGQQQRVALARALAPEPELVLLDEPFSSLDAGLRVRVAHEIAAVLRATGTTTVLVTHDQEEAFSLADQVAVMLDGVVEQTGSPDTIYHSPVSLDVAAFVGEVNLLDAVIQADVARSALGEHPVAGGAPNGAAVIMVRPEQIRVAPAGAPARVVERRFLGPDVVLRLRVAAGVEISARVPGTTEAAVGADVAVLTEGRVHAFPRPVGSALAEPMPGSV